MLKKDFKNGWTQIPNSIINNTNISFKAKGLWAYINSKQEGWDFAVWRIAKQTKEGEKAVRAGLNELVKEGFLRYEPKFKENGQVNGQDYILTDTPISHHPNSAPQKGIHQKGICNSNTITSKKESEKKSESTPQKNFEKQEELDGFKNNPLFEENRITRFPDLTDQEIDLKIKGFIYDRSYTKFEVMMSVLAEENQRVLKSKKNKEWYKPEKTPPEPQNLTEYELEYQKAMENPHCYKIPFNLSEKDKKEIIDRCNQFNQPYFLLKH